MNSRVPWLIAITAVVLLLVGGYLQTQFPVPFAPSAGDGLTGDPDTIKRCTELVVECDDAIDDLKDCSKFMHFITLGNWCNSEASNAVATCRSASEVCKLAR
jgi:hypothetical protein